MWGLALAHLISNCWPSTCLWKPTIREGVPLPFSLLPHPCPQTPSPLVSRLCLSYCDFPAWTQVSIRPCSLKVPPEQTLLCSLLCSGCHWHTWASWASCLIIHQSSLTGTS